MKKILMILVFVLVSMFGYSQTIHSDFSKTFEVTAWYEVETNDYHTIWEQSDNILNQTVKIKLSFNNTNKQTTITVITPEDSGNLTVNYSIVTKSFEKNGIVWRVWMHFGSLYRVVFSFVESYDNHKTELFQITKYY